MIRFIKNIIKKREEAKRQKIEAEIKRVKLIKAEIKKVDDYFSEEARNENAENRKSDDKINSVCPSCNSKNVNDRIKRQQGEINGSMSGSSFGSLLYSSGSSYGSISGSLDTNEVNKCNDCNHEWKKRDTNYVYGSNLEKNSCWSLYYDMYLYYKACNCKFDPLDVTEDFSSKEEKMENLKSNLLNDYKIKSRTKEWGGISIDAFTAIVEKTQSQSDIEQYNEYYNEEYLSVFGLVKLNLD